MAIPKKERLKEGTKFSLLFRRGRSLHDKLLVLYYLPRTGEERQAGFSVGKKLGNAVVRNRIKRKMKAAYREFFQNVPHGYYVLFIGRKGIRHVSYWEIRQSMMELLKRAGLWEE